MNHGGDIYRNKVNIDFSVNLNPLGTPERVKAAVAESIGRASFYPDIMQEEVRNVIAGALGIDKSLVYAGSGASELIMALVRAARPKKALLFEPAFSGYEYALEAVGCEIQRHYPGEEKSFALTCDDIAAIEDDCDMVFVCDPSNPSGQGIDDGVLTAVLDKAAKMNACVCLDESFFLLSDKAAEENAGMRDKLAEEHKNLIIVRSLTKILAMPGIRMGYVLASPDIIGRISRQLPEWNLSVCCEAGIKAGIKEIYETDFVGRTVEMIKRERKTLADGLTELGLKVFGSDTSFLLIKGPVDLYQKLLKRGILIRDCRDYSGLGKGYYRIAVRSHEDNCRLLITLRELKTRGF